MEVQIENLTIENQRLSELKMSGVDGKQQFMEGAVWMGRRICNEVENVC